MTSGDPYTPSGGEGAPPRRCPGCNREFVPSGRQIYHSDACKQRAYRRRQAPSTLVRGPAMQDTLTAHSAYLCPSCEEQHFGEQWCSECNQPCRRLGFAFECDCGAVHLLEDILAEFGISLATSAVSAHPRPARARRKATA